MDEWLQRTRTERGAMYSGWTVCGDKLFCREAFPDAAFALAHMKNVQPSLAALISCGAVMVDELQLHGPADALRQCEDAVANGFGAAGRLACYEVLSGFTKLVRPYAGMSRSQGFCSLVPSFTVSDWDAALPLLERGVELARAEKGLIFYGWTRHADRLVLRQAHSGIDGVLAQLARTESGLGAPLDALLAGPATLDAVALHGPPAKLEASGVLDWRGCAVQQWGVDAGFQKFELTGYNMGMLDLSIPPP